jgi:DNA/RNA endonuclease YhcR with UshA esterase domain
VVTAVPGVFGSQYFYVSDENGGVQVYQSKKDFPDLQNGMWLKVSGTVSTLKNGSNRINIKSRNDVKIVNNGEEILLEVVAISDLEKEDRGKLVSVEGEITERKSSFMYLDDGHDEIAVYFKKGAKIKSAELKEGSRVKVVGVVEEGTNGLEVWPRSTSDIEMMGTGKELTNNQSVVEVSKNEAGYWQRYEVVAVVGIMGVLFLFFIRARGNQTAVVLKSIINRGKDYFNKKG